MTATGAASVAARFLAWRTRRAEDARDDAVHDLRFWHYPSDLRKVQRRIDRAQRRLDRLTAKTEQVAP